MNNLKEVLIKGLTSMGDSREVAAPIFAQFQEALSALQSEVREFVSGTSLQINEPDLKMNFFGVQKDLKGLQILGPNNSVFMVWPNIQLAGRDPKDSKLLVSLGTSVAQNIVPPQIQFDLERKVWKDFRFQNIPSGQLVPITSEQVCKAIIFCFTGISV
jgi:hypothetical protein